MISSKLCSSTNDNTSYIVTQLSKDIKAGLLPEEYHVVLDEAYPCTEQEMSPWKGRNLPTEKDAFNYYLSLNRQVIERAFVWSLSSEMGYFLAAIEVVNAQPWGSCSCRVSTT